MNLSSIVESGSPTGEVLDYASEVQQSVEENLNKVYYLPVGLSAVQRDLYEILVKLHRNSIISQLGGEEENGLGSEYAAKDTSYPALTDEDLENILYRNTTLISNHPYLLVEHYMPKKLLLMESHERLYLASDKFNKFDKLLNVLQDMPLSVVIVGHNVKELDLIEAFILGRNINYRRYSGASLYEEPKQFKAEESNDNFKHSSGSSTDKKNSKDDDYVPRSQRRANRGKFSFPFTLHLITHQQLKTTLFQDVLIDFIISFDPSLNENDAHINFLRTTTDSSYSKDFLIPLIKIIVSQSQHHGFIKYQTSFSEDEALLRSKTLYSAIANRGINTTKQFDEQYGISFQNVKAFFQDPLKNKWPISDVPDFQIRTKEEILRSLNQDYSIVFRENTTNKRIKTDMIVIPQQLTIKEYHNLLAKLTIARISSVEKTINLNKERIKPLRLKSTIRHNETDNIKLKITELFKESKKLQEDVTVAEKRYERLESEHEKFEQREKILSEKKDKLTKIKNGEFVITEEEMDFELRELEEFLEKVKLDNEALVEKSGTLRSDYQQKTSDAAEKSTITKALVAKNKDLVTKLEGQGKKLRQLKNEDVKISTNEEIEKLRANLIFLEVYNNKLSESVKEKVSTLSVGRNGRVYRSTTPYI